MSFFSRLSGKSSVGREERRRVLEIALAGGDSASLERQLEAIREMQRFLPKDGAFDFIEDRAKNSRDVAVRMKALEVLLLGGTARGVSAVLRQIEVERESRPPWPYWRDFGVHSQLRCLGAGAVYSLTCHGKLILQQMGLEGYPPLAKEAEGLRATLTNIGTPQARDAALRFMSSVSWHKKNFTRSPSRGSPPRRTRKRSDELTNVCSSVRRNAAREKRLEKTKLEDKDETLAQEIKRLLFSASFHASRNPRVFKDLSGQLEEMGNSIRASGQERWNLIKRRVELLSGEHFVGLSRYYDLLGDDPAAFLSQHEPEQPRPARLKETEDRRKIRRLSPRHRRAQRRRSVGDGIDDNGGEPKAGDATTPDESRARNGPGVESNKTIARIGPLRSLEAFAARILPLYLAGFEIAYHWPAIHVLAFVVLAFIWWGAFSDQPIGLARWHAWLSTLIFCAVMFVSAFFFIEQWHAAWAGWGIFALTFVATMAAQPLAKASIHQEEPKMDDVTAPALQGAPSRAGLSRAIAVLFVVVGFASYHMTGMSDAIGGQRLRAFFGSGDARIALAWRYREGRGVPLDFSEAAIWFEKAAKSGSAKAQYDLGILYYYGLGVTEQSDAALNWFESAAKQDYAPAVSMLGLIAANDQYDNRKAMELWQRAVSLKDVWAEYLLGLAYLNLSSSTEDDRATERNRTRALFWLEKGRRDGVEPIGGLLQQVWMMVPDESVEHVKGEVFRALESGIAP